VHRHPHFLDIHRLLVLSGLFFALRLLVTVFAVIHDPAYVRGGLRRNVYKVKTLFGRDLERLSGRHDAKLAAVGINDAHFLLPDVLIDVQVFFATGKAPPIPVVSKNFPATKKHGSKKKPRPHSNTRPYLW